MIALALVLCSKSTISFSDTTGHDNHKPENFTVKKQLMYIVFESNKQILHAGYQGLLLPKVCNISQGRRPSRILPFRE